MRTRAYLIDREDNSKVMMIDGIPPSSYRVPVANSSNLMINNEPFIQEITFEKTFQMKSFNNDYEYVAIYRQVF